MTAHAFWTLDSIVEAHKQYQRCVRRLGERTLHGDSRPKLSGGKGIHVMASIAGHRLSHDRTHQYSHQLAEQIAALQADRLTTSAAISARRGRLFIDFLRNGRGTTAVATYSPRARRGFPIAAPTSWQALEQGIRPDAYSIARPWSKPPSQTARASVHRTATVAKQRITSVKANRRRRQKPSNSPRDADT